MEDLKDDLRRALGYAALGAAKVSGRRAWESPDYLESMFSSIEAGFWAEAGRNALFGRPRKNRRGVKRISPSPSK